MLFEGARYPPPFDMGARRVRFLGQVGPYDAYAYVVSDVSNTANEQWLMLQSERDPNQDMNTGVNRAREIRLVPVADTGRWQISEVMHGVSNRVEVSQHDLDALALLQGTDEEFRLGDALERLKA